MTSRWSFLLLLAAVACSGGDHPHAAAVGDGTGGSGGSGGIEADGGDASGGTGAGPTADGGGSGGAGAGGSGGGTTAPDAGEVSPAFGELEIVDVATTDCVSASAVPVELSAAVEVGTGFSHTAECGDRRYAFGADSAVLMTFDGDGANPSTVETDVVAAASGNGGMYALRFATDALTVTRFDDALGGRGVPVAVGPTDADAPSVGVAGQRVMVAYRVDNTIQGKILRGDKVRKSFRLQAYSGGVGLCQTAIVPEPDGSFSLFVTTLQHDGLTASTWYLLDSDGQQVLSNKFVVAEEMHTLLDVVKTPGGYAVLLGEGQPPVSSVLVDLDSRAVVDGVAHRLSGASFGWSLASNGGSVAVAAQLEDRRAAVRALDSDRKPLGPWVCVDDAQPLTTFHPQAAIAPQGSGWSIVSRLTDLSVVVRLTDLAAAGTP